jgi:hypothetical protein
MQPHVPANLKNPLLLKMQVKKKQKLFNHKLNLKIKNSTSSGKKRRRKTSDLDRKFISKLTS